MADHLQITERERDGVAILDLTGNVVLGAEDLELREQLQRLLAARKLNLILNFKHVNDIDTSGIGTLVYCATKFQEAGGRIAFLHLSDSHAQIPEILKLNSVFSSYQDEAEAVNSFFPDRATPHYDILDFVSHLEPDLEKH